MRERAIGQEIVALQPQRIDSFFERAGSFCERVGSLFQRSNSLRELRFQFGADIVQRSARIHAAAVVGTTARAAARVVDVGLQPHLRGRGVRVVAVHVNGVQTFQLAGLVVNGGGGVVRGGGGLVSGIWLV